MELGPVEVSGIVADTSAEDGLGSEIAPVVDEASASPASESV